MITLTTPVPVANNINNIRKVQVVDVIDNALASPPNLTMVARAFGAGAIPYGVEYRLYAYDAQACGVLAVNSMPQDTMDQLSVQARSLTGTPYTTLAAIWHANTGAGGSRANRLKAVEAALPGAGMLDAALAGTQS